MRAPALVGEGARPVACSLRSGLRQRRSGLGSLCGQCGQDGEGCAGQPRDSRGNRRCYIQGYNVEQTLQKLGGPLRGLRSLPSRATVCRVRSVWRKSGTIALARGRGVGASDQGLSASLAIIIRQWCRRPDGKKRGTRLKRLQSQPIAKKLRLRFRAEQTCPNRASKCLRGRRRLCGAQLAPARAVRGAAPPARLLASGARRWRGRVWTVA